jgi:hypothetical protein
MTEDDFSRIEQTFAIRLPVVYRRRLSTFPVLQEVGNSHTQVWDDAEKLIDLNQRLRTEWKDWPSWLFAIGQSEGDPLIPEDDVGPPFAYSVGLYRTFGNPEVIVLGLDLDLMHRMINMIGEEVRRGRRFADGGAASGILEGYDVRFHAVARRHYPEHFGYTHWFYKGDNFPALQCLWPDKQGRFPTDGDFAEPLRARQPLLVS